MGIFKKSLCLMLSALLVPLPMSFAQTMPPAGDDYTICYIDPNNPTSQTTVQVGAASVLASLQAGSYLGACSSVHTGNEICFVPPGNASGASTITVNNAELQAYLKSGSYLGSCGRREGKIKLCKIVGRASVNLEIDISALPAALAVGATIGPCAPKATDECSEDPSYDVCHNPSIDGGTTTSVKACRLLSHLLHGDYLGACNSPFTERPTTTTEAPTTTTTEAPTTTTTGAPQNTIAGGPGEGPRDITVLMCIVPQGAPQNSYEERVPLLRVLSYLLRGSYLGHCKQAPECCGDGRVSGNEQCDTGGIDTADCYNCKRPVCGDGILQRLAGEECDIAATTNSSYCLTNCLFNRCGDGQVWAGVEACDDAGFSATCNRDCTTSVCGDGILNAVAGETCDDGNLANGDGCSSTCQIETRCGNGVVEGCEECDLGLLNNWDGYCLPNCKLAKCGDGKTFSPFEECDDRNNRKADSCVNCKNATCGDGYKQWGVEQCDQGDRNDNTNWCRSDCRFNYCGDGYPLLGREECDFGYFNNNTGLCTECCRFNYCGDGYVHAGVEECDTGTFSENGACRPGCKKAFCGDGVVQAGVEVCDDGKFNGDRHRCNRDCSGETETHLSHGAIAGIAIGAAAFVGVVAALIAVAVKLCHKAVPTDNNAPNTVIQKP